MSLELGCCLDATNPAGAPEPSTYPFKVARLVASDTLDFYAYALGLQAMGIDVVVVLARETFAPDYDFAGTCTRIAQHLQPAVWVVGNEMDAPAGSGSSWSMTPADYGSLFTRCSVAIHRAQPAATVIIGGMASGQPSLAAKYVQAVRDHGVTPDGIDVHPYGKEPEAAASLLVDYSIATKLPLYVLEFNTPAADLELMTAMLGAAGVRTACWFCWADGMVDGFGLLDADCQPRPEYAALLAAARVEKSPANSNSDATTGGNPMAEFVLGFKALADQLGADVVGTPVEDEHYWPDGSTSVQTTTKGVMWYSRPGNTPGFIPFAEAAAQ